MMGVIAVVLFGGITVLAVALHARALPDGDPSVISQIAAAVFGGTSPVFYLFQAATAAILILAANTAFNGFPGLASILARDCYLPRQLHNRGDRLVFSNGVVLLAAAAAALIIGFDANIDRLIQLYIVGVFTSFTLSQLGHGPALADAAAPAPEHATRGTRHRRAVGAGRRAERARDAPRAGDQRPRRGVHRGRAGGRVRHQGHPRRLDRGRRDDRAVHRDAGDQPLLPPGHRRGAPPTRTPPAHAAQPGARHRAGLPAAQTGTAGPRAGPRASDPDALTAITLAVDPDDTRRLRDEWEAAAIPVPLTVLEAPYRDPIRPLISYVKQLRRDQPADRDHGVHPRVRGHPSGGSSCCTTRARCGSKPGCYSPPAWSWSACRTNSV